MRVPGFSARSCGASWFMMLGDRYIVTTVALLKSDSNRSPTMNVTRLATSASLAISPRELDEPRIDLDADAGRAVLLRRNDRNAAVARPEVVNDVVWRDAGELQHRVGDVVTRRREVDVRRPGGPV